MSSVGTAKTLPSTRASSVSGASVKNAQPASVASSKKTPTRLAKLVQPATVQTAGIDPSTKKQTGNTKTTLGSTVFKVKPSPPELGTAPQAKSAAGVKKKARTSGPATTALKNTKTDGNQQNKKATSGTTPVKKGQPPKLDVGSKPANAVRTKKPPKLALKS